MAVRRIDTDGMYYNLDSLLSKPECLGDETEFKSFIQAKFTDDKTQMLLVVEPDVVLNGKWEDCGDAEPLGSENVKAGDCSGAEN